MANEKNDAQTAIFAGIIRVSGEINDWSADNQAAVLKDLAAAYRFAAGGPQPGSSVTDAKS